MEVIRVGMAELKICKAPKALTTIGLGSCVGICLWDTSAGVGGLAHIMLPDSTKIRKNDNIYKFADTAIDELINRMVVAGANSYSIKEKIAGGAQMFAFQSNSDAVCIGQQNVEAVKNKLKKENIPILAEDCGGSHGRTIVFYPQTGKLSIKAFDKPEVII